MVMPVGTVVDMTTLEIPGHKIGESIKWYNSKDLNTLIDNPFTMNEDKTIYAGVTLTLVYDPFYQIRGGTPDVNINVPLGTEIDMKTLEIPGHENDNPISWLKESGNKDSSVTEPFIMNEDTTLYAGASISGNVGTENTTTITLSYNSNGGSEIKAREFTEPTEVNFEDSNYIPTREGYTFTGWYTDNSLKTKLTGSVLVSTDTTVYAGWKEESQTDSKEKSTNSITNETVISPKKEQNIEIEKIPTVDSKEKSTLESTNSTKVNQGNVVTGDQNNLVIWATLILGSCIIMISMIFNKKKKS
jgi:uncharacterized repeat protein (TIGR02543 family)